MPFDLLLSKYIGVFGNLHRNQNKKWGVAPHKPILLLAVLDEIERGGISSNLIELTPELVASFRDYWRALVVEDSWLEKIANPFRFMVQEGFWVLVKNGASVPTQVLGNTPTIRQLTTEIDGATLTPELWDLLQDRIAVDVLRTYLLKQYFGVGAADVRSALHPNPIDYEAEKLKAQAQSKFRVKQVSEDRDETGYYVRHSLFPKVVKNLYNDSCAVCGLNVNTQTGSGLIDAAHIMPFGIFHNDDPRNGIALCKNHHWGFDSGWFTAIEDYKILVSPHLQNSQTYVSGGDSLHLPTQMQYAPSIEALMWHCNNFSFR